MHTVLEERSWISAVLRGVCLPLVTDMAHARQIYQVIVCVVYAAASYLALSGV